MDELAQLQAKVDASAYAFMAMASLLHERGFLDAGDLADRMAALTDARFDFEPRVAENLLGLSNTLRAASAAWPRPDDC